MDRRLVALVLALAGVLWSSAARAGASGEKKAFARGAALARKGRFREAIAAFKKADAAEPEAKHDCYIALAYRRLRRWGLAELHLTRCFERAGHAAADLPPWTARLRGDVADGIKRNGLVKVDIRVEPPVRGARVTVSGFGRGESFAPRAVYLPPGAEEVTARAPGHPPGRKELVIERGAARQVTVHLGAVGRAKTAGPQGEAGASKAASKAAASKAGASKAAASKAAASKAAASKAAAQRAGGRHPAPTKRPPARHPLLGVAGHARHASAAKPVASTRQLEKPAGGRSRGWTLAAFGVGAVGLASALTFHILAYTNQGKLGSARTLAEYKKYEGPYDRERALAYASYAIAAVGVGTGLYLYFHDRRHGGERQPVTVTGATDGRTALIQLTWTH